MKFIFLLIMTINFAGCSMFGIRKEETPNYQVLIKSDDMEIREYSPYIIAATTVEGSFDETQTKAFRILAGYIFGDNEKSQKISMTAPVVMSSESSESEKISMTAPVVMSPQGNNWEMSFMMPSKYRTIEDLPRPKDQRIAFKLVESKTVAVIRFSGFWSEEKNQKMAEKLKSWLEKNKDFKAVSSAMFAGYDPPWTLPFLRRNEMMIEVKQAGK